MLARTDTSGGWGPVFPAPAAPPPVHSAETVEEAATHLLGRQLSLGVAEEARLGSALFLSTGEQSCVCALGRPFRSAPSPQQPAAAPVRVGLRGTGLITRHWILHTLFHPIFSNNAASYGLSCSISQLRKLRLREVNHSPNV